MSKNKNPKLSEITVAIKGAGDLASGIACRLFRANIRHIYLLEIEKPLAVRRSVSFCEAVYDGNKTVEGVSALRVESASAIFSVWKDEKLAVLADPHWHSLSAQPPNVVVDAILAKKNLGTKLSDAPLVIGLGPGFTAGRDVHLVIETKRGHNLGRVLTLGRAEENTGIPGVIGGHAAKRVFRSPREGIFNTSCGIGSHVRSGDIIGTVNGSTVKAEVGGVIRGLIRPGAQVSAGLKLGDIDPRGKVEYCDKISDKARTLGGAVLEGILRKFNQ